MKKMHRQQAVEFVKLLEQAHSEIKNAIEKKDISAAQSLLADCQEGAVQLGTLIETTEGEGFVTISLLEAYCEVVFQVHEELGADTTVNANNVYKKLKRALIQISNSIRNDIEVRPEIVFMPYKASMWDSLESIWMAADADPACDAYVVPIPYYERNADGSLGMFHYEGSSLPEYVPVVHYDSYSLEERQPDVVYIHNPYDEANRVTSIDPRFYSNELKKYTEKLVYVPYYSTSGGMSEGQALCPVYLNADYIVVQAEKYKRFFDPSIPQKKLLALGSPKFDKTIRLCQNPPEPPAAWKAKMLRADGTRKKVYFYNTSINGMLGNTRKFLMKMEYVFNTFQGREDACLLWRPHPLLESTFDSMRPQFKGFYDQLQRRFFQEQIGIYDDTPDMEKTIAQCDAYIGDAATSVTSIFGIVGKPLFILNNGIHSEPEEEDWRGSIINSFFGGVDKNRWMITQGNKLYHSPNGDYHYSFYCDLSPFSGGNYYSRAIERNGKVYVCPANAQDILVLANGRIEKRIPLKNMTERAGAFMGAADYEKYIFLLPNNYPYIVKFDTTNEKIEYIDSYREICQTEVRGEKRWGCRGSWKRQLLLTSPVDDRVIAIDIDNSTSPVRILHSKVHMTGGCMGMVWGKNREDLWLLPYEGETIARWNPETGEVREYSGLPEGFKCIHKTHGYECMEYPFSSVAFEGDYAYLSPMWGNMFVRLELSTGKMEEWIPPFPVPTEVKSGYYSDYSRGNFILHRDEEFKPLGYDYFSLYDRKLYEMDLSKEMCKEIPVVFDRKELEEHESGFCEVSDWLQYAAGENAFNSLGSFLDGNVVGESFDRERQMRAFETIAANHDGTCGENIHHFVKGTLSSGGRTV